MADRVPLSEAGFVVDSKITKWSSYQVDEDDNPELLFPESVKVYKRMRREETQLQSVLKAVKLPIERTTWRLDVDGVDPEVARFVEENLGLTTTGVAKSTRRRRGRFSWTDHLRLALTQLDFGFSFFEQIYEYREGRFHLRKLGWRPQGTIAGIDVDRDGGLVAVKQAGTLGSSDVSIPVSQLVAYVNEREGANWFGTPLLRPSYKYWLLKDRLLRVQAMTVERNGLGIPVYKGADLSDPALTPEQQQKLARDDIQAGLAIARSMRAGEQAGAAIPHGAALTLLGVDGDLPDADKPIRYYDEQMAKSALAHFLTLGTQTGSWALGTTFADFFTMSLQTVALQIADVATQHIVEDLVDINFGPDIQAPRIVFDEIGSQSAPTAQALQSLVQTKVIRPDEKLETFMRRRHGLPEADQATARDIGPVTVQPTQEEQNS